MNNKSSMMLRCKRAVASVNWMLRLWREWICFIFAVYFYAKFQYPQLSKANMVKLFRWYHQRVHSSYLKCEFHCERSFSSAKSCQFQLANIYLFQMVMSETDLCNQMPPANLRLVFFLFSTLDGQQYTWKIRLKSKTQNNSITTYEIGSNSCKNLWHVETQIYGFFKCSRMAQIIKTTTFYTPVTTWLFV